MSNLAKKLRANPTPAEIRLWRLLHPFRVRGYHFRKQVQIGPYVADFVCHHAGLVIEADGDTHFNERGLQHDAVRDRYLRGRGFIVLRLTNDYILSNPDGVFTLIEQALTDAGAAPRERGTKGGRANA